MRKGAVIKSPVQSMLGRCLLAALLGWFALIAEAAPATSVYGVTNGNDSAAATNQSPGGSVRRGGE